jgi:DNA-binding transcriptional LysR family regulator
MLRRRELDVAVCYAVDSDLDTKHGIDVDAIARQPCCLVVPESAYVRGRLVVGKLAGLSYAHVPAHLSPELTAKSLRWLADNRIAPQKRIECRFGTEIIAYAASGFGYGILPALWRATHHEAVVFAAIPDLPYEARINAYSLPHVRQWTAVFRRALRAVTKELLGKYPASSRPKVSKSVPLVSVAGERRGTSPRAPTIRTD